MGLRPRSFKRASSIFIAGTTLAFGLGAFAPVAAHAAPGDFDCQYSGTATIAPPGVQGVGGSGDYQFKGPITCNTSTTTGPVSGTIDSPTGVFSNTVCGTGSATDNNVTVSVGNSTYTASYNITFVAAQGEGTGTLTGVVSGPGTYNGDSFRVTASIVPTGGNCLNGVTAFTVAGAVASE